MASKKIVCEIANTLHRIVERQYGPQTSARHKIEYALHAALLIVNDATRHQSEKHRRESFQRAADMFSQIAETHYIEVLPHVETYHQVNKV